MVKPSFSSSDLELEEMTIAQGQAIFSGYKQFHFP